MFDAIPTIAVDTTGKFIGKNDIECTDSAGNVQILRSRNFIIAVGGRPTPLDCPGGELAVSSDDLFSMVREVTYLLLHVVIKLSYCIPFHCIDRSLLQGELVW